MSKYNFVEYNHSDIIHFSSVFWTQVSDSLASGILKWCFLKSNYSFNIFGFCVDSINSVQYASCFSNILSESLITGLRQCSSMVTSHSFDLALISVRCSSYFYTELTNNPFRYYAVDFWKINDCVFENTSEWFSFFDYETFGYHHYQPNSFYLAESLYLFVYLALLAGFVVKKSDLSVVDENSNSVFSIALFLYETLFIHLFILGFLFLIVLVGVISLLLNRNVRVKRQDSYLQKNIFSAQHFKYKTPDLIGSLNKKNS